MESASVSCLLLASWGNIILLNIIWSFMVTVYRRSFLGWLAITQTVSPTSAVDFANCFTVSTLVSVRSTHFHDVWLPSFNQALCNGHLVEVVSSSLCLFEHLFQCVQSHWCSYVVLCTVVKPQDGASWLYTIHVIAVKLYFEVASSRGEQHIGISAKWISAVTPTVSRMLPEIACAS
jgi:hypothetical protein